MLNMTNKKSVQLKSAKWIQLLAENDASLFLTK